MVVRNTVIFLVVGVILFFVLIAAAFYITPVPVTTFTPSGGYLGDFQIGSTWYNAFQLIFGPSIDVNWVQTSGIVQYLIFPFVAIWLVMYGIFQEIYFFRRITWFNSVMALVITFVTGSSGVLVRIMRGYLMMAGTLGIVFFGFILIIGIFFWFLGRLSAFGVNFRGKLKDSIENQKTVARAQSLIANANSLIAGMNLNDPKRLKIVAAMGQVEDAIIKCDYNEINSKANDLANKINSI